MIHNRVHLLTESLFFFLLLKGMHRRIRVYSVSFLYLLPSLSKKEHEIGREMLANVTKTVVFSMPAYELCQLLVIFL